MSTPAHRRSRALVRAASVWVAVLALTLSVGVAPANAAASSVATPAAVEPAAAPEKSSLAAAAADLTGFDPGYIISDAVFFDKSSMTESQIQSFLQSKVSSCQSGYTCLKDKYDTSRSTTADAMCGAYSGGKSERASRIIYKVAQACGINPRVILATLQKEQGLVTHTAPSEWRYTIAMGQGCPDTAACDTRYYGFFNQVYGAAWQFKRYANPPGTSQYFTWYAPGKTWNVLYHPNSACGTSPVYVRNQATSNLYYYTPYQPNAAALRAGYGEGDGCSSYGNRNFYNYFTDWFGSTRGDVPCSTPGGVGSASWTYVVSTETTARIAPNTSCGTGAVELAIGTVAKAVAASADGLWRKLITVSGSLWVPLADLTHATTEQAACASPGDAGPATWTYALAEPAVGRLAPTTGCAWATVELAEGTVATATHTSADGDWRLLVLPSGSLWVPIGSLRKATTGDLACRTPIDTGSASWVYTTTSATTGRIAPDAACGVDAVPVPAGVTAQATRTSSDGKWRLLETASGARWVPRDVLRKATAAEAACLPPADVAPASWTYALTTSATGRQAPSTECAGGAVELPAGAVGTATASSADGEWRRLSTTAGELWVPLAVLSQADAEQIACPTPITVGPASWTYTTTAETIGRVVPEDGCTAGSVTLPAGIVATAFQTTVDGEWRRLRTDSGELWVPIGDLRKATQADLVCTAPRSTSASWTYITRVATTARSGPDASCASGAVEVAEGVVGKAVAASVDGLWRKIATPQGEMWVPLADLEHVKARTVAAVNLRAAPDMSAQVIVTLTKGTGLTLTGSSGQWWQVRTSTRSGWVHKDYVD